MPKLHQLKPKTDEETTPPSTPAIPETQPLQVTFGRDVHVLVAKLVAKAVEQGARPSKASKAIIVERAIRALAKAEGID